jgi:hypothetical protein
MPKRPRPCSPSCDSSSTVATSKPLPSSSTVATTVPLQRSSHHLDPPRPAVPQRVGDPFLHDPVERQLRLRRLQPAHPLDLDLHRDGGSLRGAARGTRWPGRDPARPALAASAPARTDAARPPSPPAPAAPPPAPRPSPSHRRHAPGQPQPHQDRRQALRRVVVQLQRDPPPLLLRRVQRPRRHFPQPTPVVQQPVQHGVRRRREPRISWSASGDSGHPRVQVPRLHRSAVRFSSRSGLQRQLDDHRVHRHAHRRPRHRHRHDGHPAAPWTRPSAPPATSRSWRRPAPGSRWPQGSCRRGARPGAAPGSLSACPSGPPGLHWYGKRIVGISWLTSYHEVRNSTVGTLPDGSAWGDAPHRSRSVLRLDRARRHDLRRPSTV